MLFTTALLKSLTNKEGWFHTHVFAVCYLFTFESKLSLPESSSVFRSAVIVTVKHMNFYIIW